MGRPGVLVEAVECRKVVMWIQTSKRNRGRVAEMGHAWGLEEPGQRSVPQREDGGTWKNRNVGSGSVAGTQAESTNSSIGSSVSSNSTNGKAAEALGPDDRTSYQGVDGVLAFRYWEGRIALDTPGSLSQATTGSQ